MTTNWTHDLEITFMEIYQCHPIIWDPKHRDHKDRNKVHDAWNKIGELMNIPPKELKSKKDSLMTTYRMHKRRIKASEHSGASTDDIYTPIWFAFGVMDSFLGVIMDGPSNKTKNTITTLETDCSQDNEEETQESVNTEINSTSNAPSPGPSNTSKTIRRRRNPPELIDAKETINKALNTLNEVLKERSMSTSIQQEDECDLYGRMLAKKLRKFPEHERVNVMYEIDGTIIRLLSQRTIQGYVPSPLTSPARPLSADTSSSEPIYSTHITRPHSSQFSYSHPITVYDNRPLSNPAFSYIPTSLTEHQSLQNLSKHQQSQQSGNLNINMQRPVTLHIPDQSLSSNSTPEITPNNQSQQHLSQSQNHQTQQRDKRNSISVLSDLLIFPSSSGHNQQIEH